jgi:succinyl-CoA synthetase alpha subunit
MSILINKETKVLVQGISGSTGRFQTKQSIEYGTKIVGGVSPGRGGTKIEGVPVFNTVEQAVKETGANASIIYVPKNYASEAILEAVDSNLDLTVCITQGIPTLNMVKIKHYMKEKKTRLIGPYCPGIITPGECKMGIMPNYIHKKGNVGVVSHSGTLTYESTYELTRCGIGQSTVVGIGGDYINGTNFIDALKLFNNDPETHLVVMIGEIGGTEEEEAAIWIKNNMKKPVVAVIAGRAVPPGKSMGYAGAASLNGKGSAIGKIKILEDSGVKVVYNPAAIGETVFEVLKQRQLINQ